MTVDMSKIAVPPLPTLDYLNATVPEDVDAPRIASEWLTTLAAALESDNPASVRNLFVEDSWWRDMLSFTWDFRTFHGLSSIVTFLEDRIKLTHPRSFKLRQEYLGLQRPYDDIAWINAIFDFETDVGIGLGILRLVPTATGQWKAHVVFTNLEDLKGFPEQIGALRDAEPDHANWEEEREAEIAFADSDPSVLIIGGGQSGLEIAARLKAYGMPALVIERNEHIGDNWRNRYKALAIQDPIWYDHMPYLPFPSTWPMFTPVLKMAKWLESYADALDLNVWTSTEATAVVQDPNTKKWSVTVKRRDGTERLFNVNHVILSTGRPGTIPYIPDISKKEIFKGQTLHTSEHKKALDHVGMKVVIIGACKSAHDLAKDYYRHGIDVTMFQRSSTTIISMKSYREIYLKHLYDEDGPTVDIADRLSASFPHFMSIGLLRRSTERAMEMDREIIDALHKRGFRTNMGVHGAGVIFQGMDKAGGYYLDSGTSRLIADGKIKLKNDSQINEFTETGLLFENGSELAADVVMFATGFGDCRENIRRLCGDEVFNKCPAIWGFDKEGEINGNARGLGTPGLWYFTGSFAHCRFHSKHLALQIKAQEEGLFGERYGLSA